MSIMFWLNRNSFLSTKLTLNWVQVYQCFFARDLMSYSVAEPTNFAGLRLRSNRGQSKSLRPFLSVYNTDFSNIFVPKIYVSAQQHWTPIVELIYTIQMLELVFVCLLYCLLWANLRSSEIPRTVSCIYLLTKLEKLAKECAPNVCRAGRIRTCTSLSPHLRVTGAGHNSLKQNRTNHF